MSGSQRGEQYQYVCRFPNCTDSFKTRFSLKRHTKKHSGEKPFTCHYPTCNKSFAEKSTLKAPPAHPHGREAVPVQRGGLRQVLRG